MGYFAANRNIYKDSVVSLKKKKAYYKVKWKGGMQN